MINSHETQTRWTKMAANLGDKINKRPEDTLMMRSNWDQRRKQEIRDLVDLTTSVHEKYGHPQSFLLKLRIQEKDPQKIPYKNPVSSKWNDPNFGATIIDNRSKKVELIREIPDLKEAYQLSPRLQSKMESRSEMRTGGFPGLRENSADFARSTDFKQLHHCSKMLDQGKWTTQGSKFGTQSASTKALVASRSSNNLFRQTNYRLENDPVIQQRLNNLSTGVTRQEGL